MEGVVALLFCQGPEAPLATKAGHHHDKGDDTTRDDGAGQWPPPVFRVDDAGRVRQDEGASDDKRCEPEEIPPASPTITILYLDRGDHLQSGQGA